ncbi:MAG: PilZ protein [Pseudomonadota bacterium]|nr:PilZ protein [Pseudomonadota bacterium]
MEAGNTHKTHEEKRSCERISLAIQVELETENGESLCGETRDVSLGGVLIYSQDKLDNLILGSHLKLYLVTGGKRSPAFPCRISRISHCTIGLELDKSIAASFGMLLTKGLVRRMK